MAVLGTLWYPQVQPVSETSLLAGVVAAALWTAMHMTLKSARPSLRLLRHLFPITLLVLYLATVQKSYRHPDAPDFVARYIFLAVGVGMCLSLLRTERITGRVFTIAVLLVLLGLLGIEAGDLIILWT
jgi:hypothetical protein